MRSILIRVKASTLRCRSLFTATRGIVESSKQLLQDRNVSLLFERRNCWKTLSLVQRLRFHGLRLRSFVRLAERSFGKIVESRRLKRTTILNSDWSFLGDRARGSRHIVVEYVDRENSRRNGVVQLYDSIEVRKLVTNRWSDSHKFYANLSSRRWKKCSISSKCDYQCNLYAFG